MAPLNSPKSLFFKTHARPFLPNGNYINHISPPLTLNHIPPLTKLLFPPSHKISSQRNYVQFSDLKIMHSPKQFIQFFRTIQIDLTVDSCIIFKFENWMSKVAILFFSLLCERVGIGFPLAFTCWVRAGLLFFY